MSVSIQPEFHTGMLQTFSKTITEGEAALYAGLIGANLPEENGPSSNSGGAPQRTAVHELLIIGMIYGLLRIRVAGEHAKCISMNYEYLATVFCGDRIDTTIELLKFDEVKRLATFKTDCFDQEKNQLITGQVVLLVQA